MIQLPPFSVSRWLLLWCWNHATRNGISPSPFSTGREDRIEYWVRGCSCSVQTAICTCLGKDCACPQKRRRRKKRATILVIMVSTRVTSVALAFSYFILGSFLVSMCLHQTPEDRKWRVFCCLGDSWSSSLLWGCLLRKHCQGTRKKEKRDALSWKENAEGEVAFGMGLVMHMANNKLTRLQWVLLGSGLRWGWAVQPELDPVGAVSDPVASSLHWIS